MDPSGVVSSVFGEPRALVGMIHLAALPGTPGSRRSVDAIAEAAVGEAREYHAAGFTGLMIENMHDRPYLKGVVGPEIVAAMAAIGREVRGAVPLPLGVQVLAAANRESLAVAQACGAAFVRVEGFVFAHVADEGIIESEAAKLLRYRRALGAEGIRVFADVKKKHAAHAITADVDVVETARAAEFFLADAVIVSGIASGRPTDPEDVAAVAAGVGVPTFVGSGLTAGGFERYAAADGFIVGTSAKRDGVWTNPVDPARAREIVRAFQALPPPGGR
jgi:membrane complex biogenesis BtpA family protein